MVQYRKPPRRSSSLTDRRSGRGNTPTELAGLLRARIEKEMRDWNRRMEQEHHAHLRHASVRRSTRGGGSRYWGQRPDTLGGKPLGPMGR